MVCEFDKTNITDIAALTKELQEVLNRSLTEAKSFYAGQQNNAFWTGSAKKSFLAFLDLVTQYHEKIVSSDFAGDFSEAAEKMLNELNSFGGNEALTNLKRI